MSAVDNVDARIARLQHTLDEKRAELRARQTRQRYNPALGVDEAIATGQSLASLDVKVIGGRNMLFNTGFLAGERCFRCYAYHDVCQLMHAGMCVGKTTYVRAWLEPQDATLTSARLCTRKQPVQYAPWCVRALLCVNQLRACIESAVESLTCAVWRAVVGRKRWRSSRLRMSALC